MLQIITDGLPGRRRRRAITAGPSESEPALLESLGCIFLNTRGRLAVNGRPVPMNQPRRPEARPGCLSDSWGLSFWGQKSLFRSTIQRPLYLGAAEARPACQGTGQVSFGEPQDTASRVPWWPESSWGGGGVAQRMA